VSYADNSGNVQIIVGCHYSRRGELPLSFFVTIPLNIKEPRSLLLWGQFGVEQLRSYQICFSDPMGTTSNLLIWQSVPGQSSSQWYRCNMIGSSIVSMSKSNLNVRAFPKRRQFFCSKINPIDSSDSSNSIILTEYSMFLIQCDMHCVELCDGLGMVLQKSI